MGVNRILCTIKVHVEHPYVVMRRVSQFTKMYVTAITRVSVRAMFMCINFSVVRATVLLRS
ncbi:MAG: hypothetical protein JRM78_02760 [Nitrososphaerota archaeon]|nr:hypothetical protein [Nitrososphaerota archaeon]